MKTHTNIFESIISPENLFTAWNEFKRGKNKREDVLAFEFNLEQHIFELHRDLKSKKYRHGPYSSFYICDPKIRHIHKATVRDRILHHAIFRVLNPIFEPGFIANSFSCRVGKGTHKGVWALEKMVRKVSRNYSWYCFALKCDVRKFFDSIDHDILIKILGRKIADADTMWLLTEVIESFTASRPNLFDRKGLPIGNLTSQLFANVYMNEFDQFMKHAVKAVHYARYTDDFLIVSNSSKYLEGLLPQIHGFLEKELKLNLHPKKISIRSYRRGIDFLGYVVLPYYRLLRTKTKWRVFRKLERRTVQFKESVISEDSLHQSLQSYLGVLSHANSYQLQENLQNQYWFWRTE